MEPCDPDAGDVRDSLSGDPEAFARIVRRYQAEIARLLWRFARERTTHEELVQDAFVEAYRGLRSFRGTGRFAAWLGRIAVRAGYAFWKRRARDRLRPWGAAEDLPESEASGASDARSAAERVHRLLSEMRPRDRLVLTLQYLEGRTVGEISDLSGLSRAMVKVQAWRARARLKRLLEREGER